MFVLNCKQITTYLVKFKNNTMQKILISCLLISLIGCSSEDIDTPFDCSASTLAIILDNTTNVSSCTALDGSIRVSATGGKPPYLYSLNGGAFTAQNVFQNLATGRYTIQVKDANECILTLNPSPEIISPSSDLTATSVTALDNSCLNDNGSITISANGGKAPYTYKIGNANFISSNVFNNLNAGTYTLQVKDSNGCVFSFNATVTRGDTGISWSAEVQNIITTNCNVSGCHNGSQAPNLTTLANVQANRESIKTRTGNKSMPPAGRTPLSEDQIKKISCWVDDGAKNN